MAADGHLQIRTSVSFPLIQHPLLPSHPQAAKFIEWLQTADDDDDDEEEEEDDDE